MRPPGQDEAEGNHPPGADGGEGSAGEIDSFFLFSVLFFCSFLGSRFPVLVSRAIIPPPPLLPSRTRSRRASL